MVIENKITKFVIKPKQLVDKINLISTKIIDSRWYLDDEEKGLKEFKQNHIEGAIFFNIEKMSKNLNELPHMFPDKKQFSEFARNNGIRKTHEIIIYDQTGFFCSSRVWFTFMYYGFKNIKILDGGIENWKKNKLPLTRKIKAYKKSSFNHNEIIPNLIINKNEIDESINKKNFKIIDARPKDRYLGIKKEPRPNLRRGNIKNSINIPYDSISKDGKIKDLKDLEYLIYDEKNIKKNNSVICYCGSGITACNIIFVLKLLGHKKIKLYDGSWAEWGKIK